MAAVTTDAGTVERCTACSGLWFDRLEHKAQASFAKSLDTGDSDRGARLNRVDRITCPKCVKTPLTRMVDNDQPHIWFEACPSCNGRFFDAGEFRDLSEKSLSDLVRGFLSKGRGV
jgi:Zn-finger nucleic acid-binding protein